MRIILEQYAAHIVLMSLVMVVVLGLLAYATYYKKGGNPVVFGLTACAFSPITAFGWWPLTLTWWSLLVPVVTTILYGIGLKMKDEKDDPWYYAAVAVALTGKALIVFLPKLAGSMISVLSGETMLPNWALVSVLIWIACTVVWMVSTPVRKGAVPLLTRFTGKQQGPATK